MDNEWKCSLRKLTAIFRRENILMCYDDVRIFFKNPPAGGQAFGMMGRRKEGRHGHTQSAGRDFLPDFSGFACGGVFLQDAGNLSRYNFLI